MGMKAYHGKVNKLEDTPFGYTMKLIGGKWKMVILYIIAENQPIRYNEIKRMIDKISYKTLSEQLKDLIHCGLIERIEYPEVPPRVEYSISELGESLIPCLEALCFWGVDHYEDRNK